MIQRKQTLFLLLAFVLTLVCVFLQGAPMLSMACLILSSLLSIVTIFLYTRRKLQARLCLVDMLLLVVWYILLAAVPRGASLVNELGWSDLLPAISILLLFLARKGILDDEKLVRSLDRIR